VLAKNIVKSVPAMAMDGHMPGCLCLLTKIRLLQCSAEQGRSTGCFFNRAEDKKCFSGSFLPCLGIGDLVVVEAQITFAQAVG